MLERLTDGGPRVIKRLARALRRRYHLLNHGIYQSAARPEETAAARLGRTRRDHVAVVIAGVLVLVIARQLVVVVALFVSLMLLLKVALAQVASVGAHSCVPPRGKAPEISLVEIWDTLIVWAFAPQ